MNYKRHVNKLLSLIISMLRGLFTIIITFTLCFSNVTYVFARNSIDNNILGNKMEFKSFIDSIFQEKMKELHIPGAVITVVKDGKVFFSKGYGYSNLENKIPMNADKTLVRIASVTKVFTYTALMQLYEQGKIDLNEDVNRYLKGYTVKNKYSTPVTSKQLLTHTSGIDDNSIGDLSKNKRDLVSINDFLKKHLPEVVREPGSIINYSSYDTALAGGIIEQVSGNSLNCFINDNIFKPLDMKNSMMDRNLNPKGLAQGYLYNDCKFVKPKLEGYFNNYAVGSIISTSDDMAKFMIAHLNNGEYKDKRILKEDTAINMHNQHVTFDYRLPGMAYGFNENFIKGYRTVEHAGYSPDNIYSQMCLFPEEKIGVFICINQGLNDFPNEIIEKIVNNYFPHKLIKTDLKEIKTTFTSKINLKDFIGTYRFSENPRSTFHKGNAFPEGEDICVSLKDKKNLLITGRNVFTADKYTTTITQVEPLVFKRGDNGEYIVFKKDKNNQIYYLAQQTDSWHGTYEKLKWYEISSIQIGVTLFCLIIFLLAVIVSIIRIIYIIIKRKISELNSLKKYLLGLSFIISFLNIFFLGRALYVLGEPTRYGISMEAKLLLCIPILNLVLTLLFLVGVIVDIRKKDSKLIFRIYNLIIALAGILYIWFLNYWNMFGFKY